MHVARHTSHATRHTLVQADSNPSAFLRSPTRRGRFTRSKSQKMKPKSAQNPQIQPTSPAFSIQPLPYRHLIVNTRASWPKSSNLSAKSVALGAYHTAAITSVTCALYTWGDNTKGQVTVGIGSSIQTTILLTFFMPARQRRQESVSRAILCHWHGGRCVDGCMRAPCAAIVW